jgi:predicted PurR-regulated permease PerM
VIGSIDADKLAEPDRLEGVAAVEQSREIRSQLVNPWKLVVGGIFTVVGVVAAIYLAFRLQDVITHAFIALVLAVGLQGPVARLHTLGVPRPLGLLVIYLGVIASLVGAGWLLLPPVVRDLQELATQSPTYVAEAQAQAGRLGVRLDIPGLADVERHLLTEVAGDLGSYVGRAVTILNFTLGLFGGVLSGFFVLILSIFIVTEGPAFRAHLLSLLPPDTERRWYRITEKIAAKIQGWMLGTVLLGFTVGGIITASLLLLGSPYPFLLGFVAGLGELVPMVGPIVAAVPAISIAAFAGWGQLLAVLALYVVVQQLENYVLVPRIMGRAVDLPGLVVLVAFLIGSALLGVLGGMLAMPLAAVAQVLWLDWAAPGLRSSSRRAPATPVQAPRCSPTSVSGWR